jgi:uroporphyrinogen-III synthase
MDGQGMKRVLVTRAAGQASELAERLRRVGLEPVVVPVMELAEPATWVGLDAAWERLREFDWLLFTSANAVEVVGKRFGGELPAGLKVAAVGQATAKAVRAAGWGVDLVPAKAVAESLAEALVPEVGRGARRFLLVRAEVGREEIPERLRAAGAEVVVAAAYRNGVPESSVPKVREMFGESKRWPDAIAFTSGSSVTNLLALLEVSAVVLPKLIPRVSIGPVTSEVMRSVGFAATAEAQEATLEALVEAVVGVLG